MKHIEGQRLDALLPNKKPLPAGNFDYAPATIDMPVAGHTLPPGSTAPQTGIDYSEEAIPERDPAYRMHDGTLYEVQTVEVMPSAVRRALARCLEELGMSPSRAAMVASL